jgi:hypothetical protein
MAWSLRRKVNFEMWNNPYFFSFRVLLDKFHEERKNFDQLFSMDQKIDFIFDDRTEKTAILNAWDEYLGNHDEEMRRLFGAAPRFER